MDGGAWWAAVHGVTRSRTRLSDFTFTFHFHALEKEMATHSSVLAWRMGSSAFSKSTLNMGKFLFHILLKPRLENFEYLLVCEVSAIV